LFVFNYKISVLLDCSFDVRLFSLPAGRRGDHNVWENISVVLMQGEVFIWERAYACISVATAVICSL
jgi:hypothetical protein